MPKNDTPHEDDSPFVAGLERWERPHSAAASRASTPDRQKGTLADRFLRGLEDWERPMRVGENEEVVLPAEQPVAAWTQTLRLKVKGSIEVIAGKAAGVWTGVP